LNKRSQAKVATFSEAAACCETIAFAVKGLVAESVLELASIETFTSILIMDVTNPISGSQSMNGLLYFYRTQRFIHGKASEQIPER
jgi:hypothetical protein